MTTPKTEMLDEEDRRIVYLQQMLIDCKAEYEQELVRLVDERGYQIKVIADATGINYDAVRIRLSRIRRFRRQNH